MTNTPMTDDDMRELFGDGFDDYQAEAEQKWGQTAEWKESQRRNSSMAETNGSRSKPREKPLRRPCPMPSAQGSRPILKRRWTPPSNTGST